MAHKLKIKRTPHINRDKTVGKKFDYTVRCKCRGRICCLETFTNKTAAEKYMSEHWARVNALRVRTGMDRPSRLADQRAQVRIKVDTSDATTKLQQAVEDLAGAA